MPKFILTILSLMLVLNFCAIPCRADWIHAEFSEDAGIDSIERFLVIQDIDSNIVFGEPILPLGDINVDGNDDILICRSGSGGVADYQSFLFYGGNPPDSIYDRVFTKFKPNSALIGDINGDGYSDIGFTDFSINDFVFYLGGALLDDTADFIIPGILSWSARAADLDNDGILEIPLSTDINWPSIVNIYQINGSPDTIPEYVIPDTSTGFGNNLATGDFNGDGFSDLAVAAYRNRDSCFVKFYWGGPEFDTIPDLELWSYSSSFGILLVPLGDFNGDKCDDILIASRSDDPCGIYFGGPDMDNSIDVVVNRSYISTGYVPPTSAAAAGDVNNDGYPDLITGYINRYAYYFDVRVFLGGPDTDSTIDVYIENLMIPHPQVNFGAVVSGIGDFNGDGVDDFAVRAQTSWGPSPWLGEVHFFAGWDSKATDVDDDFDPSLPNDMKLRQNYPNPFNTATTIEFNLPRSGYTEIKIFNLLGEEVAVPLRQNLSAGDHRVVWDGSDKDGNPTSTGIYFYQILSGDYTQARKMILLK